MGSEDAELKIRIATELKRRVQESAKQNKRSMNAEIIYRLEKSFVEAGADVAPLTAIREIIDHASSLKKHFEED